MFFMQNGNIQLGGMLQFAKSTPNFPIIPILIIFPASKMEKVIRKDKQSEHVGQRRTQG
jgi:hypothetical protein